MKSRSARVIDTALLVLAVSFFFNVFFTLLAGQLEIPAEGLFIFLGALVFMVSGFTLVGIFGYRLIGKIINRFSNWQ